MFAFFFLKPCIDCKQDPQKQPMVPGRNFRTTSLSYASLKSIIFSTIRSNPILMLERRKRILYLVVYMYIYIMWIGLYICMHTYAYIHVCRYRIFTYIYIHVYSTEWSSKFLFCKFSVSLPNQKANPQLW